MFVRVANKRLRAEAGRLPVGVADRPVATGARLTRVTFLHAASYSVGALQVAGQTCALGKAVAENGTLCVGSARRGFARVGRQVTGLVRRVSLKLWQAEALRRPTNQSAPRVGPTRVWRALSSLWYCKKINILIQQEREITIDYTNLHSTHSYSQRTSLILFVQ